jgi:WD40 repeat protein
VSETLTHQASPVYAVATLLLPDGTPIAVTGSGDETVRVWDLTTGQPHRAPLTGHTSGVTTVATLTLPDGTPTAITASHDETVRVWDLATGRCRARLPTPLPVTALAVQELSAGQVAVIIGMGNHVARVDLL